MAKKSNNNAEDIKALENTKSNICTGMFYGSDIHDAMDNLIAALEGDDKNNYILAARAFDYGILFIRARMAEIDSKLSQFTVKVVELAKKKGWYEEPKAPAPAPEAAANTEATKEAPATKTTAKKAKK